MRAWGTAAEPGAFAQISLFWQQWKMITTVCATLFIMSGRTALMCLIRLDLCSFSMAPQMQHESGSWGAKISTVKGGDCRTVKITNRIPIHESCAWIILMHSGCA